MPPTPGSVDERKLVNNPQSTLTRILVSAGSKHGATQEIAERIGSVLKGKGHEVTVSAPADVTDLSGYDAVVLGSAVYAGHPPPKIWPRWLDDWTHPSPRGCSRAVPSETRPNQRKIPSTWPRYLRRRRLGVTGCSPARSTNRNSASLRRQSLLRCGPRKATSATGMR